MFIPEKGLGRKELLAPLPFYHLAPLRNVPFLMHLRPIYQNQNNKDEENIMSMGSILSTLIFILFSTTVRAGMVDYDDDTKLSFIWEAASGGVDHYNTYVSTDFLKYVLVGNTSEPFYTVEGLYGHTYKVKVEAVDAAGNVGPMSEESDVVICGVLGDVSLDSSVTAYDAALVIQYIEGKKNLSDAQISIADVTGDGKVDALDALLILQYKVGLITQFPVQTKTTAPVLAAQSEKDTLMKAIAQLEATALTKEEKQVLENLKSLIRNLLPKHTLLLQNFSNPYNLDTWIPYQLSESANVTIRIYNVSGQMVRALELGHKSAGYYLTKDKAAYWDGCSSFGEKVASGVYFYTLQAGGFAGSFTATRKMVIVK